MPEGLKRRGSTFFQAGSPKSILSWLHRRRWTRRLELPKQIRGLSLVRLFNRLCTTVAPQAAPQQHPAEAAQVPVGAVARGAGGSSGGRKSGGSSGSGTSVTPTGGSAATTTTPPWRVVRFKRSIPCSPDVVGDTAGVLGAPSCTKCNIGPHCHGEGQLTWGASGTPLPGFGADGSRIPGDWSKTDNVPIRRVVKACVTFLQDFANFHNRAPEEVAGVVGAQGVSDFQMHESTAPRKPRRPWVGKPPPPPSAREGSGPRVAAIAPPSVAPEHPFLSAIRSNALLNQIQHADSS